MLLLCIYKFHTNRSGEDAIFFMGGNEIAVTCEPRNQETKVKNALAKCVLLYRMLHLPFNVTQKGKLSFSDFIK